jgi:GNAT superfamily N-acetyltransferase
MATPASIPGPHIREATPEDSGVCARIFYDAFKTINQSHNFPPEIALIEEASRIFDMLFSHPGFGCLVAEYEGRIVGSNCMDERSTIFGIGPISVDPAVQNKGLGRALMTATLDRARRKGAPGVRLLQAAFHNRSLSLYSKLGFDVREPVSVMSGHPGHIAVEGCTIRPAAMDDLDACNRLCHRVHGHDRSGEVRDAISQGAAVIVERQQRLTGYAAGFGYFGHAVAESNLDLQALIGAAKHIVGPGILVPTRNAELFRWCLEHGFRVFQPMMLMTKGMYQEPAAAYLPSVSY